jgi:homoserine dehydrogenase
VEAHTGLLSVLKFGSSILRDVDGYRIAAAEIDREVRGGRSVLVVVSASYGTTDHLLAAAADLSDPPVPELLASLLTTGEDASVALLGMALTARGLRTGTLSAEALALTTTGPLDDAIPVDVAADRLVRSLSTYQVVVAPGFVGRDLGGAPSLLGRGGSDLTALFLASALGAHSVRLVKDVEGVYPADPSADATSTSPLRTASWREVARVGNGVVQGKALGFAERHGLSFRVASPGGRGTLVGPRGTPNPKELGS